MRNDQLPLELVLANLALGQPLAEASVADELIVNIRRDQFVFLQAAQYLLVELGQFPLVRFQQRMNVLGTVEGQVGSADVTLVGPVGVILADEGVDGLSHQMRGDHVPGGERFIAYGTFMIILFHGVVSTGRVGSPVGNYTVRGARILRRRTLT